MKNHRLEMKKLILFLTSFITLVGIYLSYLGITIMEFSGHYFSRAFEGMLWGSLIIFPIVILLAVNASVHCAKKNRNWLIKETLIVLILIILLALSHYSWQDFYIFGSIFLLTQIVKYVIFLKYCIIQEKN